MNALTEILEDFLRVRVLPFSQSEYSRLVLGGLPSTILEQLFVALTHGDGSPWQPISDIQIPVFFIKQQPTSSGSDISRECNWDYALAIRNSSPRFLLLVDPLVWDDRTYSIINATDTIGRPLPPIKQNVPALRNWSELYAEVVEMAASRIGFEFAVVESAIRECLKDLPFLDPTDQHLLPWEIARGIAELSALHDAPTMNQLARVCGLLPFEHGGGNFRRSRVALKRLTEFLQDVGIDDGVAELQLTSKGASLEAELAAMGDQLRSSAGSASAIARVPSFYCSKIDSRQSWREMLSVEIVETMLTEIGRAPKTDNLVLTCTAPLNPSPSRGEPFLVRTDASMEARHPVGAFPSLQISRIVGRQRTTVLRSEVACQSPTVYNDAAIPNHTTPIKYTVEAPDATAASVQIISIDNYVPSGFVTCPEPSTVRISRPRRTRTSAPWRQEIFFSRGGYKTLTVYCDSAVTSVRITEPIEHKKTASVNDGVALLQLDLDDDVEILLDFADSHGQLISSFVLTVSIDSDVDESVPSQFHALVRAHQDIKSTVSAARPSNSWLRAAETQLLNAESSWRPILTTPGWSDAKPQLTPSRQLGDLRPQVDPRPDVDPPAAFVDARTHVVDWLCSSQLLIPEKDLASEDVALLAAGYLRAYREWSNDQPSEACWADTICLLEPEPKQYGGHAVAAFEPIAVLVSPLHPIRLGWQVAAQRVLRLGLDAPCPLAGLLDPHRCPEVLPLALTLSGSDPRWRSYLAISCQDPMWGLYWDSARLRDLQHHGAVTELTAAGVVPRGIQSGFTASQARKTLEEVRHVLPTRAILRVGIVGSGEGSTSCAEGLIGWSRESYSSDSESLTGPRSIEIYDSRASELQPSSEDVSSLADDTGHHVRWFSSAAKEPARDLAIVDHLGASSPMAEIHPWKSPTTEGGLIRSRVRLDRNNAEIIVESRSGNVVRSEDGLLDELGQAVGRVESLAEEHGACSHIALMPQRQVIGGELEATRFLAVSSTEIDPACFARSAPQAGGFLWDYELPHAVGPGEQRSGFFLLARPPVALRRAVSRATRIVTQSSIDVEAILIETSRRGIPILKRLAAGGSLARGELGMLLAVRLLQDSFRGQERTVRLPVHEDGVLRMILPIDPYASPLEKLRQGLCKDNPTLQAATRPDLLVACIHTGDADGTHVRLVPLEVKFRDGRMSTSAKAVSLAQANNLGIVLHHLLRATPLSELWRMCGLGFLCEVIDHGFRVYGDPSVNGHSPDQWVNIHQACLADIASGHVTISVAEEGRLIIFDESPSSYLEDVDTDGFAETLVVCREDSRALLEDGLPLSDCVNQVASLLNFCGDAPESTGMMGSEETIVQQVGDASDSSDTPSHSVGTSTAAQVSETMSSAVPPDVRAQVGRAFFGFIGNRAAIDTLRRGALRALLSDPPQLSVSYLLTGNPSTGKTELARRVAQALDLPFVSLDGRGLTHRERLFDLIDGRLQDDGQQPTQVGTRYQLPELEYPPLVVFIDEVHLVPRPIQESLLTALEPKDRSVLLANRVARLPQVTFLLATTRPSEVDMALRTRCTEVPLQDYTEEEVAAIVQLGYPDWPESLRRRIARYGRIVPRIALDLARELADEVLVSEHQDRDLDSHLEEVRRTRLIDENGLSRIDIEYLELLDREGRPLGERNILTMLGNIDKDRFIEEVEPLLVGRMKLVRRTARGREITTAGHRYLIEIQKKADSE